jgi:hypothetical protein
VCLDIAMGNDDDDYILLNRGDGVSYELQELTRSATPTISLLLTDVDGDGLLDLIAGRSDALSSTALYLNTGSDGGNAYGDPVPLALTSNINVEVTAMAAADINGDGLIDVSIGNYRGDANCLLYNSVNDGFVSIDLADETTNLRTITAADVNGDGQIDIISGRGLLLNAGGGNFQPPTSIPGLNSYSARKMVMADVNEAEPQPSRC